MENRPLEDRVMIETYANLFEIKVHYMIAVVSESDIENDEEEMQEKYLSADERQSTIRQSGGGDDGVGRRHSRYENGDVY